MQRNHQFCFKIIIAFLLILTGLISISLAFSEMDRSILYNGNFEIIDKDGFPEGWYEDAYLMDPGYSNYSVYEKESNNQSKVVRIQNAVKNDARIAQVVEVEPNSLYCFSGFILADHIEEGHGANLSIEGVYAFSEKVYETEGQWKYIEYYGETGPDQYTVTVFARVGGYSGMSKGTAEFDDLKLVKIDSVPENIVADRWFVEKENIEDFADTDPEEYYNEQNSAAWPWLTAIIILYTILVVAILYHYSVYRDHLHPEIGKQFNRKKINVFLILALVTRVILSYSITGYSVDVNCFLSWGQTMLNCGPVQFYQQTSFCDYPPLYMYCLGFNSWLVSVTNASHEWTRVIFRFIPSLCDVVSCIMLIKYSGLEYDSSKETWKSIVLFMAFHPAFILNSAAWGQMDSVLCLLLLAVAIFAVKKKWMIAIPIYVVSILVKPQALMLGFLGLIYMIMSIIEDRKMLRPILAGCAIGIFVLFACIIPFGLKQESGWLIRLYENTLSSYPYATVNTANIYYLLGGNWNKIETAAHIAAPIIFALLTLAYGLIWFIKNKVRKLYIIELIISVLFSIWFLFCAITGASWAFIGIGAMTFAFVIVISLTARKKDMQFLPYLGALLFILLYVFGIKMHERYLFPALFLLLYAWILQKDKRILIILLLYSSTIFLNEGIVLDNSIRLGSAMGHLNSDTIWLADILSIMNIIGALYSVIVGIDLLNGKQRIIHPLHSFLPVKTYQRRENLYKISLDYRLHWNKRDTLILIILTVVYGCLSLMTLGSTKAPQTYWSSSGEEETITFDLLQNKADIRILYFGGVSRNDFFFSESLDGENWSDNIPAQMDQQQCWKWKYVTQSYENGDGSRSYYNQEQNIYHFSGRYIRLISGQVGLSLNEILFRDVDGNTIPAKIISRTGEITDSPLYSDPLNLLDEQDSMDSLPNIFGGTVKGEAEPSWWNSTYFDEIYHARTGYEFIKNAVPYETTHPPLGKVFISWSIAIFGMTPFGWRFAGAVAGILMLPGIYLLAKQLTKRTWLSAMACILMSFDCMHLTQTQIATIDSFPVLFIIFAYSFMLRFVQTNLIECNFKKILLPLALSGIFMGFSIASKWIGIYAGIGLAALYFWHCFRTIKESPSTQRNMILKKVIHISLLCVVFFVIVPILIYLCSYIPYFSYDKRINTVGEYLTAVWKAQIGMLNYHSTPGLGMNHPFYSPWWEWPIIGKPMYYASEQYITDTSLYHHSIFCFGNPVIWWGSIGTIFMCFIIWIKKHHYLIQGETQRWHLTTYSHNIFYGFVLVGFLAQYLPWVLVPRGTYIYHYFASVPFLILTFIMCLYSGDKEKQKALKILGALICTFSMIAFFVLLPYVIGMTTPTAWIEIGKKILHIYY